MSDYHMCGANFCTRYVPLNVFMCATHWARLSKNIQDRLWDNNIQWMASSSRSMRGLSAAKHDAKRYIDSLEREEREKESNKIALCRRCKRQTMTKEKFEQSVKGYDWQKRNAMLEAGPMCHRCQEIENRQQEVSGE